ncbi:acyloxyacyl hydrolase [Pseudomonas sp. L-22-4S-12]|uniref:acyloxyacyl hydrolase n=1 Tax=unclassified Pseudomonas TaxID=196821 RepID=UPI0012F45123|nr:MULTISPECIES: acyloxyacyl hydrolase [unclassified Pseudomonas]MWV17795.1 acyloxyacyl hydrolase [Pseudomonas sp. L-22-4S-12]VXB56974.1 Lipid A deacylase PagL [Pseudomonas sp. 8AS]
MNKILTLAAAAALGLSSLAAQAVDFSAAVGRSGESTNVYRLGAQWNWDRSWMQSDVGRLTGYWDAGYTYWDGDKAASNHSLSFTPVFVYEFAGETVKPYLEAGIGVAFFDSTELEEHDLGSSFQFEDRLGAGLRFSGQEIGIRAMHYSNGGIKEPNDGVETYTLHYRLSF